MAELKETYLQLLYNYTDNDDVVRVLWNEIEDNYSDKKRHYHTLQHLENLLWELLEIKEEIEDWNTILFTLYYHDIVYNAKKSNNEERSAELAVTRMEQLSVPVGKIELCRDQILATKSHTRSVEADTNYFTDADLSILGQSWETYSEYFQKIRKEYAMYPDFLYNPGRKKVLKAFLSKDVIFKTAYFNSKYEAQAIQNMRRELELL